MKKKHDILLRQGKRTAIVSYKLMRFMATSFVIGFLIQQYSDSLFNNGESTLNRIKVDKGDQSELVLTDGTKVVLNSGSELQFPKEFSDDHSRIVLLNGEGYFEVKKGNRPFIVKTELGNIMAIGTKFNISAYENECFEATLIEGLIKYKINRIEKVIKPGQQVIVDDSKHIIIKNIKDPSFLEWRNGTISFSNEKLGNVINRLERHYNTDIILDPELANIKFTGKIREETIEDVLKLINITTPIKYERISKKEVKILSRK